MNSQNITIVHQQIATDASPDELDVLEQSNAVCGALRSLNYNCTTLPISLNLQEAADKLRNLNPTIVFNLVESVNNSGRFISLAPLLLEELGCTFTGSGSNAMTLSSNKILAKKWMELHKLPTSPWSVTGHAIQGGPWIVKSVWEHASIGLDDSAVVHDPELVAEFLAARKQHYRGEWFTERFIQGREFNVTLLEVARGVKALPVAEIHFDDYPADKPHIVGYKAKWEPHSFEYSNTCRRFSTTPEDTDLEKHLQNLALRCWTVFELSGYARIDFRVDELGQPWILEVNANPCLSPDAGFIAAANQAGLTFTDVITNIIDTATNKKTVVVSNPIESSTI